MRISIEIETTRPLTGTAWSEGRGPVSFVGWMALLRVVAELTEATEQPEGIARSADEPPRIRPTDERPAIQTLGNGAFS